MIYTEDIIIEEKITFNDIIGYEKEKQELMEIKSFVLEREKFTEAGARIPKGIILIGETGNGKTMMAKALASEINIPFLNLTNEQKEEDSVKNIRDVFAKARENAPCIIFIDEIDKICGSNNHMFFGFESEQNNGCLRELLTQMDGLYSNDGIIVLATANDISSLNQSLLRSGRFDRRISVKLPGIQDREMLLKHYSKTKQIENDVDFKVLAKRTAGVSCADINNILNEAVLISIREKKDKISMDDIETAIDRVSSSSCTDNQLSEDLKRKVAIHEIGHAIVMIANGHKERLNKISIISYGKSLGYTRYGVEEEYESYGYTTKSDMLKELEELYGGYAAETIYLGDTSTGVSGDIMIANTQCKDMITRFGMLGIDNVTTNQFGESRLSQFKQRKIEKIKEKVLNRALNNAKRIIKRNKSLFDKLCDSLIENNVIYKEDIIDLIQDY